MQLMNYLLGGKIVSKGDAVEVAGLEQVVKGEYGKVNVNTIPDHPLFAGIDNIFNVWMSHGDSVHPGKLAEGFKVIGWSDNVAAIADDQNHRYGVQFHPEVTHTENGLEIIHNFARNICGCSGSWTMGNYIEESKQYIRDTVGLNDVICFVSGGVDSSYVATLLAQTEGIGNVYPVYIEALMREGETEEVVSSLKRAGVDNLIVKKYEQRFIDAVAGMSDPEEKRKAIGNLFGEIQQEVCVELGLDPDKTFLAQGTLYTDLIESGHGVGKKAATIKSHHNANCEFIDELKAKGLVVEPNRWIFKDEVREAARTIKLGPEISERQPYPGPGLGIRLVCGHEPDITFEGNDVAVKNIANKLGYEAFLLPVKTVGVQGDSRTYSYAAMIQGPRDWEKIRELAASIPKECNHVNRGVYNLGEDRERGYIREHLDIRVTRENVDALKKIDHVAREVTRSRGFTARQNQEIFVLAGADVYGNGLPMVVDREPETDDFMTVTAVEPHDMTYEEAAGRSDVRMTWECLDEKRDAVMATGLAGSYVLDVTDKPPATTCWE
jgi:GMP synthase (glutamine-hydrolysing)